jgi:hypothetical protein
MQNTDFKNLLQNQPQLEIYEKPRWSGFHVLILLGIGGGALFGFFGFLLLVIFTAAGGINKLLNYYGVGLLVLAFICFGIAAHFMDKSDERKRADKKVRAAKLNRNDEQFYK